MYELHFNSELKFSKSSGTFKVGGVSVKSGFIKNKHFIIPKSELKNIAETLNGSYLLTDHSRSVKDVIGEVTKTKIIENKVLYEATLTDSGISEKIKTGLLKNSSVGLQVERLQCSICGCEYAAGVLMVLYCFTMVLLLNTEMCFTVGPPATDRFPMSLIGGDRPSDPSGRL